MSGKSQVGGPFALTDQHGRRRSLADFQGKFVILYFGYMFCPDICPTDMVEIAQLIKLLGSDGDRLQPVFITLDSERDTPENLGRYVAAFHPGFVALRGSDAEVRQVATAYKTFFEKVEVPGASKYLVDHTAYVYVIDRQGKYAGFFPPGTSSERMAIRVRELISEEKLRKVQ